jgi:HSP20 family protein
MTLNNLIPWRRKEVPIRKVENNYSSTPAVWRDLDNTWGEIEQLFDRYLGLSPNSLSNLMDSQFSPSLDVHETDKEFQINVEVPGMNEKEIEVTMTADMLTISGEKKEEKEENKKGMYRMERRYGSFSRSIPLPENYVDTNKVEATYNNGVLKIRLPKAEGYDRNLKKIPVSTGESNETKEGNGKSTA